MPTHLAPARPLAIASGAWKRLSAALSAEAADLADRDDLLVTCAPGAAGDAPGCFIPDRAAIEIDGTHLECDPATCTPHKSGDRARYAVVWGILVHEAAHAHHTRWHPQERAPARHAQAALLLEESRIEAAHLARRPADRDWLRAAMGHLLLEDLTDPATGAARVPATLAAAARSAALILARTQAGVFTCEETHPVDQAARAVLGDSRLSALAALWHRAQACGDDDGATMMELGRAWTAITTPTTDGALSPEAAQALADAVDAAVAAIVATRPPPPPDPEGEEPAPKLPAFDEEAPPDSVITGTRPPTPGEQADARRLARTLGAAAHREPVATTTTAPVPPGRLRMRAVLARHAQQAAGALPTAEPFLRTRRRAAPDPPLRLGIACDVSGSMYPAVGPVASAAYILARACTHLPEGSAAATVAFNDHIHAVCDPRRPPTRVTEFSVAGADEDLAGATDALDRALELRQPGAARLLVIVSDGAFALHRRESAQARLDHLRAAGCGLVWLNIGAHPAALAGCETTVLTEADQIARVIGGAAQRALRSA